MSPVVELAYAADAAVLVTYGLTVRRPSRLPWFNWANAVGGPLIIASEVAVGAWPALILSAAFTVTAWVGLALPRR